jgi:streptogramin lyase
MRISFVLVVMGLFGCSSDSAAPPADARLPPAPLGVDLLVASRGTATVLRYDGSGAPKGVFAKDPMLVNPIGITFGPDGNFYAAAGDTDHVLRFDGKTGASMGEFTSGGSIVSPRNVNFGPDGNFYVADGMENEILRFAPSGQFMDTFIQGSGISGPTSFTFGPDGNVYVANVLTSKIGKFNGQTGAFIGDFATSNLSQPHDVAFGPDGNLYVTNSGSKLIQRFHGDSGAFMDTFVNDPLLLTPLGLSFGPDGNLYVANQGHNDVRRYEGKTGAFIDAFVAMGAQSVNEPSFLAFFPTSSLTLTVAQTGALVVQGAQPGGQILLVRGSAGGSGSIAACAGLTLALGSPAVDQTRTADESGATVVEPASGGSFVAVDVGRCAATEAVAL